MHTDQANTRDAWSFYAPDEKLYGCSIADRLHTLAFHTSAGEVHVTM